MSPPDAVPADIAAALSAAAARIGVVSAAFHWYDTVGSTNDEAARLARAGAQEGTVVASNTQTAGRGRLGRTWISPPHAGLYVSVVLRPRHSPSPLLTLATGVALADGIQASTGLVTTLKWPNDIYCGGRKLAGILAEAAEAVVVGFGINIRASSYPRELADRITSLERELGRPVERGLVLAECLAALAAVYGRLQRGDEDVVLASWRRRAAGMMGRSVDWGGNRGVAEDIAADGALLVRTAAGLVRVISGEVTWT